MLTPNGTYFALSQKDKFNAFYQGFKEYLKSKLSLIQVSGSYSYYSCGHDYHHHSDPDWKPFENLENYCEKEGFDFYEVKDLIEQHIETKIICECQIVNDEKTNRRAILQKTFGLDFGEPGRETCGLYEDDKDRR